MGKIAWSENASLDLKEIFQYISKDSLRYAKNQIKRIRAGTIILKTLPKTGRIVPELNNKNTRELIEGNYRIIYRILENNFIEILTIHHTARKFITLI